MVYMTDIFEQNVDYQKLDAFAQNVTSSLINSTTTSTTSTHNTAAAAAIPGATSFIPFYLYQCLEELQLAFCLGLCLHRLNRK